MENKNNIWQIIVAIIVIVVLALILMRTPKPVEDTVVSGDEVTNTDPLQDPGVVAEQMCFIWNTEAGDKAQLSMDIRGNQVIGEFNWVPAEKDSKTGIFQGTVVTGADGLRTANALWKSSGEGMMNTEELIVKFGGGMAAVGFGEMIERPDGVWAYANPNELSFAPNLSETDCGDEAMD